MTEAMDSGRPGPDEEAPSEEVPSDEPHKMPSWRWWLLPVFWLLVVAVAAPFVVQAMSWLPYLVAGVLVLVPVVWILVSTLSPAVPDRTCPSCGDKGLVKMRRGEPGVHCQLCGFRDDDGHVAYLDEW